MSERSPSPSGDTKPSLLVVVPTALALRDMLDSGAFDALSRDYEVSFLNDEIVGGDELSRFGNRLKPLPSSNRRKSVHMLLHHLMGMRIWEPIYGEVGEEFFNTVYKPGSFNKLMRYLYRIHKSGLGRLFEGIAQRYLDRTAAPVPPDAPLPAAVLVLNHNRHLLTDDAVRWARKCGIPSTFVQMSYDAYTYTTPTAKPDICAVWGEQAYTYANLLLGYLPSELRVVGSPRCDQYVHSDIDRADARSALNLPQDKKLLLYCGDPLTKNADYLGRLDQAIQGGQLPKDVGILFKPHPAVQSPGVEGYVDLDNNSYRHVEFIDQRKRKWPALETYPLLLKAVDAMITPYSTMGLEGAAAGLPLMGFYYFRREDEYEIQKYYKHLRVFFDVDWCVNSRREADFIEDTARLITMTGDKTLPDKARTSARFVCYWDDRSYAERILGLCHAMTNPDPREPAQA